jgi:putative aminopeptidase FrvX
MPPPSARDPEPRPSAPFNLLPASVLARRLAQFQGGNLEREVTLRNMFIQAGCPKTDIHALAISAGQPPDIACALPGTLQQEIIVAGHFDYIKAGRGVVDDWSGASMLPSLFQTLAQTPHRHTFLFIGFSNEEKGLVGSRYYVLHLSRDERSRIAAMVNLECLGLNDAEVWAHHADPILLRKLFQSAHALGLPLPIVNVENAGTDDAESFRQRHLPTITIHTLTPATWRIIHTRRDQITAINMGYYYENYRLVAVYLSNIDRTLN